MARFKTLLIAILTAAFMLTLTGCDFLSGLRTEPAGVEVNQEGALPEWLLLAHRSAEDPDAAGNEIALNLKERVTENDNTAEEGLLETEQPGTTKPSQPETTGHPVGNPSSPAPSQSANSSDESSDSIPKPGTMEYIIEKMKQEEAAKEAKKQEKNEDLDWWEDGSEDDSSWW